MWAYLPPSLVLALVSLCGALPILGGNAAQQAWTIEHRMPATNTFSKVSEVSLQRSSRRLSSSTVSVSPFAFNPKQLSTFENLNDEDVYTIRIVPPPSSSVERPLLASMSACALRTSAFGGELNFHTDTSGDFVSVSISSAKECDLGSKVNAKKSLSISPKARVYFPSKGPSPLNVESLYTPKDTSQPEPSFLRKYWYYILPLAFILLASVAGG